MSDSGEASVARSVVVDAPIETAFAVFTKDMGSWWPPEHHILDGKLAEMVFEPRVGGRIYDVAEDGSECQWARVLAYEPPKRLVFSWDVSLEWKREEDPAKTSEVEVTFSALTSDQTRVELLHRCLDRHGEGWQAMRDAVGLEEGWGHTLRRFAEQASIMAAQG